MKTNHESTKVRKHEKNLFFVLSYFRAFVILFYRDCNLC
jgi:hypothetical protein